MIRTCIYKDQHATIYSLGASFSFFSKLMVNQSLSSESTGCHSAIVTYQRTSIYSNFNSLLMAHGLHFHLFRLDSHCCWSDLCRLIGRACKEKRVSFSDLIIFMYLLLVNRVKPPLFRQLGTWGGGGGGGVPTQILVINCCGTPYSFKLCSPRLVLITWPKAKSMCIFGFEH